jgi:methyltransferase (TIGR00027 family)
VDLGGYEMKKDQVSLTAMMAAYERGYHAKYDDPKIFNDFLAFELLLQRERTAFAQQFTKIVENCFPAKKFSGQEDALSFFMQNMSSTSDMISRARYAEDNLEETVKKQGVQQYLILGAGLDTFAFRRPDMGNQLRVFEVDHPATQLSKRQRIAELGWDNPLNLNFVPIDFTKDNLETAIKRSFYDSNALTFISWLGVTYYLPRVTVFATLRTIADSVPKGSSIIFDYYDADTFVPEKVASRMQGWKQYTKQAGEPIITGFEESNLAIDLASLGLRLRENLSPSEIEERYFQGRTDNYHATEHTHYAWVVVE